MGVQSVKRENLTASCLTRNVGCGLLSGGLASAVLYVRDQHGVWCHRSAHVAIAISLVFFCWSLIVCGSSTSLRSAVRMASSDSCFAVLKPTEGRVLGSQSSQIFAFGWASKSSSTFFTVVIRPLDLTSLHNLVPPILSPFSLVVPSSNRHHLWDRRGA
jgi:hypothetical protein